MRDAGKSGKKISVVSTRKRHLTTVLTQKRLKALHWDCLVWRDRSRTARKQMRQVVRQTGGIKLVKKKESGPMNTRRRRVGWRHHKLRQTRWMATLMLIWQAFTWTRLCLLKCYSQRSCHNNNYNWRGYCVINNCSLTFRYILVISLLQGNLFKSRNYFYIFVDLCWLSFVASCEK